MSNKVLISNEYKRYKPLESKLEYAAEKLFKLTNQKNSYLEIYIVGKSFMNNNVLALPVPKDFPRPDIKGKFLGEIYLNPEYIEHEGEDIFFMALHGFLHLLGYDHKKKSDRIIMESKEKELFPKIEQI
jgi:rRNA maturation RNase YbeY